MLDHYKKIVEVLKSKQNINVINRDWNTFDKYDNSAMEHKSVKWETLGEWDDVPTTY